LKEKNSFFPSLSVCCRRRRPRALQPDVQQRLDAHAADGALGAPCPAELGGARAAHAPDRKKEEEEVFFSGKVEVSEKKKTKTKRRKKVKNFKTSETPFKTHICLHGSTVVSRGSHRHTTHRRSSSAAVEEEEIAVLASLSAVAIPVVAVPGSSFAFEG
jgi:hypothetical protein